MFDLIPKLLKSPIFFTLLTLTLIMLPSVIYKTGESERLAISVSVGIDYMEDKPKEEQVELSLMFLTPQSSSDLEKNFAVTSVNGENVSDCLNKLEARIGKEIGLSHCQVIVISKSVSENGALKYLDSFTRTNDLTTNSLIIGSDKPRDLLEAQISESAKISISLSNILEYIGKNVFTEQINIEKFYANYYDESGVSFLPFINTIENKESGGGSGGSESGGEDANEGSSNAQSTNSQSPSGGGGGNDSEGDGNTSKNAPTVGSKGPAEKEVNFENKIGVFNKDKLVNILDNEASEIFNLLYTKKGRIKLILNDLETQFAGIADVTIEVEDKKETIGYSFINGYPVVNIDLTLYCKVSEVNAKEYTLDTVSVVNAQISDVIKEAMFNEIETKFSRAINFAKENNVDLFNVGKYFYRLCTNDWANYKLNLKAGENYMQNVIFLLNLKMVEFI